MADYSKADFDSIRNMLTVIDWVEVLSGDMEHAWSTFKKVLEEAVNRFVPTRCIELNKYKKAIWMTYKAVRKKHNLYHRFGDTRRLPDQLEAKSGKRRETSKGS